MSNYKDKFCSTHNQWYADFLDECPICVGEKMDKQLYHQIKLKEKQPTKGA